MKVETDYKKLAVLLLPTFLRKSGLTAIVRVLMQPLASLHDTFKAKRDDHLFDLSHNGQVCRLKDALNSLDGLEYDKGFEIDDINALGDYIIACDEDMPSSEWLIIEDEPNVTMVFDEAEINVDTEAFVVFVPSPKYRFNGSKPADPRIVATVEKYRLVSRTATYRAKSRTL